MVNEIDSEYAVGALLWRALPTLGKGQSLHCVVTENATRALEQANQPVGQLLPDRSADSERAPRPMIEISTRRVQRGDTLLIITIAALKKTEQDLSLVALSSEWEELVQAGSQEQESAAKVAGRILSRLKSLG